MKMPTFKEKEGKKWKEKERVNSCNGVPISKADQRDPTTRKENANQLSETNVVIENSHESISSRQNRTTSPFHTLSPTNWPTNDFVIARTNDASPETKSPVDYARNEDQERKKLCEVAACPAGKKLKREKLCKTEECPAVAKKKLMNDVKKAEKKSYSKKNPLAVLGEAVLNAFADKETCKMSKIEKKYWKKMKYEEEEEERNEQFQNLDGIQCKSKKKSKETQCRAQSEAEETNEYNVIKMTKATSCKVPECPIVMKKQLIKEFIDKSQNYDANKKQEGLVHSRSTAVEADSIGLTYREDSNSSQRVATTVKSAEKYSNVPCKLTEKDEKYFNKYLDPELRKKDPQLNMSCQEINSLEEREGGGGEYDEQRGERKTSRKRSSKEEDEEKGRIKKDGAKERRESNKEETVGRKRCEDAAGRRRCEDSEGRRRCEAKSKKEIKKENVEGKRAFRKEKTEGVEDEGKIEKKNFEERRETQKEVAEEAKAEKRKSTVKEAAVDERDGAAEEIVKRNKETSVDKERKVNEREVVEEGEEIEEAEKIETAENKGVEITEEEKIVGEGEETEEAEKIQTVENKGVEITEEEKIVGEGEKIEDAEEIEAVEKKEGVEITEEEEKVAEEGQEAEEAEEIEAIEKKEGVEITEEEEKVVGEEEETEEAEKIEMIEKEEGIEITKEEKLVEEGQETEEAEEIGTVEKKEGVEITEEEEKVVGEEEETEDGKAEQITTDKIKEEEIEKIAGIEEEKKYEEAVEDIKKEGEIKNIIDTKETKDAEDSNIVAHVRVDQSIVDPFSTVAINDQLYFARAEVRDDSKKSQNQKQLAQSLLGSIIDLEVKSNYSKSSLSKKREKELSSIMHEAKKSNKMTNPNPYYLNIPADTEYVQPLSKITESKVQNEKDDWRPSNKANSTKPLIKNEPEAIEKNLPGKSFLTKIKSSFSQKSESKVKQEEKENLSKKFFPKKIAKSTQKASDKMNDTIQKNVAPKRVSLKDHGLLDGKDVTCGIHTQTITPSALNPRNTTEIGVGIDRAPDALNLTFRKATM